MSLVRSAAVLAALLPSLAHAQPISAAVRASPAAPSASAAVAAASTPVASATASPAPPAPPGVYPPGTYPPSMYPAGVYPPGAYPPGMYPPGAYPYGAWPPGAWPYPPPPVQAPPPTVAPAPEPPTVEARREWYGWQTLIADGASLATLMAGGALRDVQADASATGLLLVGGAGFALGAPLLHWRHGNTGRGLVSLGLRVGMPLAGIGLIGAGLEAVDSDGEGENDGIGLPLLTIPGFLLLLAWIPTSVIVDSAGLAYEEKPPTVSFMPVVQPQKGGATFGLSGTF